MSTVSINKKRLCRTMAGFDYTHSTCGCVSEGTQQHKWPPGALARTDGGHTNKSRLIKMQMMSLPQSEFISSLCFVCLWERDAPDVSSYFSEKSAAHVLFLVYCGLNISPCKDIIPHVKLMSSRVTPRSVSKYKHGSWWYYSGSQCSSSEDGQYLICSVPHVTLVPCWVGWCSGLLLAKNGESHISATGCRILWKCHLMHWDSCFI